jgi:hypothetical protein
MKFKSIINILLLVMVSVFLVSCSTKPYGPLALSFYNVGYDDYKVGPDTFVVRLSHWPLENPDTVKIMILYRCAQLTVQNGFDYFIVKGDQDEKVWAPAKSKLFQMFKGIAPDNAEGVYNAKTLMLKYEKNVEDANK